MAQGDLYELVVVGASLNQQVLNVFFYRQTTVTGGTGLASAQLRAAFQEDVQSAFRNLLPSNYQINEYRSRNLFDVNDFSSLLPGALPGQSGNLPMATPYAIGFRTNRGAGNIRRGFKRIGPIDQDNFSDGSPIAAYQTNIDAFETALIADIDWTAGVGAFFEPVVVKRIKYTAPSGNDAYRLPTSLGEAAWFRPTSWVYTGLTTQSSRKVGVGA